LGRWAQQDAGDPWLTSWEGSIPATSTVIKDAKVLVGAPLARGSRRARTHSGHTRTRKKRSRPVSTGLFQSPWVRIGRPAVESKPAW